MAPKSLNKTFLNITVFTVKLSVKQDLIICTPTDDYTFNYHLTTSSISYSYIYEENLASDVTIILLQPKLQ